MDANEHCKVKGELAMRILLKTILFPVWIVLSVVIGICNQITNSIFIQFPMKVISVVATLGGIVSIIEMLGQGWFGRSATGFDWTWIFPMLLCFGIAWLINPTHGGIMKLSRFFVDILGWARDGIKNI